MEVRHLSPAEISATAFIVEALGNKIALRTKEGIPPKVDNCKLHSESETSCTIKSKQVRGEQP